MKILYELFMVYQRAMFYVAQASNEIGKPLRFFSEFGILILLLDNWGIKIPFLIQAITYVIFFIVMIGVGWLLCHIGVLKYTTALANDHNPQLQEILKRLEK